MIPCPTLALRDPSLLVAGAGASLVAAHGRYPVTYDEIVEEIRARIAHKGAANKLDLGGLVFWKHTNTTTWMTDLNKIPDSQVLAVTRAAFAPGLGDAAPGSLLSGPFQASGAAAPTRRFF